LSFRYVGANSTTLPWPWHEVGRKVDVIEIIGVFKKLPLLVALAASFERTGDAGLPPDPDKCPKNFWASDKTPHPGWKWEPPVWNQGGYWYNPKCPGMQTAIFAKRGLSDGRSRR
jgi:hypothetical protein